MNRRKAILSVLLIGGGAAASWGGYKWFRMRQPPDVNYLEKNRELIAALAEVIIPATDTPGAREAGVDAFIVAAIRDCSDRKIQHNFIDGLKAVSAYSNDKYNKAFTALTAQQQQETVTHFRETGKPLAGMAGKVQNKFLGKSFYAILREYTTTGYCTSKLGAQQGLAYQYIPGNYQACIPLEAGQKAWATK
jgi:Gluconate 2-dehydrogenase subunit 3